MRITPIAGLLASFAGATFACSGSTQVEDRKDPSVVVQTPPIDAGTEMDAADAAPSFLACGAALVDPTCATTMPAPTTDAAIGVFLKTSAVPLRCDASGGTAHWDLRPLVQLYGAQKMFMMGEVHGTNEIGIVSSLVFERLASQKLVNIVAFELPMDFEGPLQQYVDTGHDATAEKVLKAYAKNMFGPILTNTARSLVEKGLKLRIGAVDIPYDPQAAVAEIQDVATKLTSPTQKENVLAMLPAFTSTPPSATDIKNANTYFDHIIAEKAAICAELSAAECDRLVAMTHALWASTLYDEHGDDTLWFARREEVLYYNLHTKIAGPNDRMYLHMGAFHTNKFSASAGSRMAKEYALTKGHVVSVAPAYDDGSVIWYGKDMDLAGAPLTITTALSQAPAEPLFVSTTRPSATCETNPLDGEPDDSVGGGTRGELYDGYIHYGKLTSEKRPGDTALSPDSAATGATPGMLELDDFRARILEREQRALSSGASWARTSTSRHRR